MKPTLLWIGDAVCASGFERGTRYMCQGLSQVFDIRILGLCYLGDPLLGKTAEDYAGMQVFPAWPGGDVYGVKRTKEMVELHKPAVVVIQNDPWNFQTYIDEVRKVDKDVPIIGIVAVDGKNCRGAALNDLSLAIFWTAFGEEQARLGGYTGQSAVIPLGVDLDTYKPSTRLQARRTLQFDRVLADRDLEPWSAFLVGVVGRNQPRKRLDLTIEYFSEWLYGGMPVEQRTPANRKINDAALWLHVSPTGEQAFDLEQLAAYYGIVDRVLIPDVPAWSGMSEKNLATVYATFDVGFSTTQGEGFGLPCFEMMACGRTSIVPDWAAFGDLLQGACLLVPVTSHASTINTINVVGGIADKAATVSRLQWLYNDRGYRDELEEKCLALVAQPRYRWENIGNATCLAVAGALGMIREEKAS